MRLKIFHKNDMGLISESTSDSSDVGINTYLSPYAKFKDVRGTIKNINSSEIDKSYLFSYFSFISTYG